MTKSDPRKNEFISSFGLQPLMKEVRTEAQSRNGSQSHKGCCFLAWFLVFCYTFHIQATPTCLVPAPPSVGGALPRQSLTKKLPQTCLQVILRAVIPQLRFPLPRYVFPVCFTLRNTNRNSSGWRLIPGTSTRDAPPVGLMSHPWHFDPRCAAPSGWCVIPGTSTPDAPPVPIPTAVQVS